MTYGPPSAPPTARPATARREPWRYVLVTLGCLLGPVVAVPLGFFGAVTYSGCFLSCSDPQPGLGAAMIGLALLLLVSGPLLAAVLLRRAGAVALALLGVVVGGALLVASQVVV